MKRLPAIPANARPSTRSPLGKRDVRFRLSVPQIVYDRAKEEAQRRGVDVNRFAETVLTEVVIGGVHGRIITEPGDVGQGD